MFLLVISSVIAVTSQPVVVKESTYLPEMQAIQIEVDPDYPCELIDENMVHCPAVTPEKVAEIVGKEVAKLDAVEVPKEEPIIKEPKEENLKAPVELTKEEKIVEIEKGIPLTDYRKPIYEEKLVAVDVDGKLTEVLQKTDVILDYEKQYIDATLDTYVQLDLSKEGIVKVGYNSNVFNITPVSGQNVGANVSVELVLANITNLQAFNYSAYYLDYTNETLRDRAGSNNMTTEFNVTYNPLGYYDFRGEASKIYGVDSDAWIMQNELTISAWIYKKSLGTENAIFMKYDTNPNLNDYGISIDPNNDLRFYCGRNTTTNGAQKADLSFNMVNNTWYFITVSLNISNDNISFYKNGVLESSSASINCNLSLNSTELPSIGVISGYNTWSWNGSIDEVRIYNRSLSSTEVLALYNNQSVSTTGLIAYYPFTNQSHVTYITPEANLMDGLVAWYPFNNLTGELNPLMDYSGNGNNLTNSGGVYNQSSSWYDYYRTTTTGLYNILGNNFTNNCDRTISMRILFKSNSSSIQTMQFYKEWSDSSLRHNMYLISNASSANYGKLFLDNYNDTNGPVYASTATGIITSPDTWYHIIVTVDKTNNIIKFYNNGVYISNTSINTGVCTLGFSKLYLLDVNSTSALGINGSIDDVRIYNRSLSAAEVALLYNSSFNKVSTDGQNATYRFNTSYNNLPADTYYWNYSVKDAGVTTRAIYYFIVHTADEVINAPTLLSIFDINTNNYFDRLVKSVFGWPLRLPDGINQYSADVLITPYTTLPTKSLTIPVADMKNEYLENMSTISAIDTENLSLCYGTIYGGCTPIDFTYSLN